MNRRGLQNEWKGIFMAGEIEFFRKRFIGGFNQQDVIDYISKLAHERNNYRVAKEKAEQDAQMLTNEIKALQLEIQAAKQEAREGYAYKVATLEAAAATFSDLDIAFRSLCANLNATAEAVCSDLDKSRVTVMSLPSILEQAGEDIKALQASCNAEKDAAGRG